MYKSLYSLDKSYKSFIIPCILLLVFFLGNIYNNLYAEESYPVLIKSDIKNLVINDSEIFSNLNIGKYPETDTILIKEFEFHGLLVQHVNFKNTPLIIEYYDMSSTQGAFGLYSIWHTSSIAGKKLPVRFYAYSKFGLKFAWGKYYITIQSENPSKNNSNLAAELAFPIIKKISGEDYKVPEFMDQEIHKPYIKDLKLFCGPRSIEIGMKRWYDDLDSLPTPYNILLMPIMKDEGDINIAFVDCIGNQYTLNYFYNTFRLDFSSTTYGQSDPANNILKIVKKLPPDRAVYMETTLDVEALQQFLDLVPDK